MPEVHIPRNTLISLLQTLVRIAEFGAANELDLEVLTLAKRLVKRLKAH
jgi:hypothetical protein